MTRLFVAVELPLEVRERLHAALPSISGGRPVRSQHMHLTLRFVGELAPETTCELQAMLQAVEASPHQLAFTRPGTFPALGGGRTPTVLFMGLERHPALLQLQGEVDQAVEACGQPREARAFVPHVTVARLKDPPVSQVQRALNALEQLQLPSVPVSEFVLVESVLDSRGPTYHERGRYTLSSASRR